jgi:hypothetical protein
MNNLLVMIAVGAMVVSSIPTADPISDQGTEGGHPRNQAGNVYYMMPTHQVASLQESNVAKSVVNAVYRFGGGEAPIDVLVYSNWPEWGDAIVEYFAVLADIVATPTLDDSDLLSLDDYDVVIIHSNGARISTAAEQSVKDYLENGGNIIGSHDVIWKQFNNPILEEVFGATARGDGSTPGMGFYMGDFDVCIVPGHPIVEGLGDCWREYNDQFYYDVEFKRNLTVLWETSWKGEMIPVAWTFSTGPEEIEADVHCHPKSLNRWSMGNWITCYVELPTGYDPRGIDVATVFLNGLLKPELDPKYSFVTDATEYITDHDNDGIEERMVKFIRSKVQLVLHLGMAVELVLTGELESGTQFEGATDIRHFEPIGLVR